VAQLLAIGLRMVMTLMNQKQWVTAGLLDWRSMKTINLS